MNAAERLRHALRAGRARAAFTALAPAALLMAVWLASPGGLRENVREQAADLMQAAPSGMAEIVVVDIDRATLQQVGPWPWSREALAALLATVTAAGPSAVAVDILLAEPDRLSPAVLARRLAELTGRDELERLAAALPDGDALLAAAIARAPTALGFVMDPWARPDVLPAAPVLVQGDLRLPRLWTAPGLTGPTERLAAAAEGFGLLAMDEDADGRVRRVPLLVVTGETPRPGLALEAIRLREGASTILLSAEPLSVTVGERRVRIDSSATVRLAPDTAKRAATTVSAAALLADPTGQAPRLAGRIVLVGGSAPELGGLRHAGGGVAVPSVHLQATAAATLLAGGGPVRPVGLMVAEVLGAALLALAAALAPLRTLPGRAALLVAAGCAAWIATASLLLRQGLLLDPAGPPLVAGLACAAAALAAFVSTDRRARALRAQFEQRLPPAVVRRIAAAPASLRLQGETREITALFTDLEGFTEMTERSPPEALVALLDSYLATMTRIVVAHGGMVEKIVGDAVHGIFNAPLDLPEHPRRAFDCAKAMLAAAEALRRSPLGERLRLGRTRIGLETGEAIVGDVGGSGRLDYTAYGSVMNTAARLEAANKTLGTALCIGPVAAARIGLDQLRLLGASELRGLPAPLDLYTLRGAASGDAGASPESAGEGAPVPGPGDAHTRQVPEPDAPRFR
jgi:adenylate cyclase